MIVSGIETSESKLTSLLKRPAYLYRYIGIY